ncbi:phospholipase D-like domain-containing protein [Priestia megaterium]
MFKEIDNINGKLVLSFGECSYQEVLDDFKNSNSIQIVTFNMDSDPYLKEKLDELNPEVELNLVSNIPNRYARYYYGWANQKAKKTIDTYFDIVNPENFDAKTSAHFNFKNHAKIIATDNIAYIGSANFTGGSRENFECGIIIKDKDVIQQIREEFIGEITDHSIRFYGTRLSSEKILVFKVLQQMNYIYEILHEQIYNQWDAPGGRKIEYVDGEYVDIDLLISLEEVLLDVKDLYKDIEYLNEVIDINIVQNIFKLLNKDGNIKRLAIFVNDKNSIFELIHNHPQSHDLDIAVEDAMNERNEMHNDLVWAAKDELALLDQEVLTLKSSIEECYNKVLSMEKDQSVIDNT